MSFKKGFLNLLIGNVGVQVISLAFYPVLARIYSPADFGAFGLFTSLVSILGIFACAQLHHLFPNPKSDHDALPILYTAAFYIAAFCVLLGLVVHTFYSEIFPYFRGFTYWLPISVGVYSLSEISKMWLVRFRAYSQLSINNNVNRIAAGVLKVASPKTLGLIYSEIIANLVSVFLVIRFTQNRNLFQRGFSFKSIKSILRKYWMYPTILSIGTFAQYSVLELPVFMLSQNFTKEVIGHYVLANKLVVQPFWLLTGTLAVLFHNKFIDEKNLGTIRAKSYLKYLGVIFLISLPVVIVLEFFGKELFILFLGDRWMIAGDFVRILAPLAISKLMIGPALSYFLSHEKVTLLSLYRALQLGLMVVFFRTSQDLDIYSIIQSYVILDFLFDTGLILLSYLVMKFPNYSLGTQMKLFIKKLISSSDKLKLLFTFLDNTKAKLLNKKTAALLELGRNGQHQKVFDFIYKNRYWYSDESVSGYGSTMEITENLRPQLESFVRKYSCKTFLDVPCGDFNWMKAVDLGDCKYIGGDLVPELIEDLNKKYASDMRFFLYIDLVTTKLPDADVIFVRDCFIHLENSLVLKALQNLKRSNIKYLLTTHSPTMSFNMNITTGEFRDLNFTKAPFSLPVPELLINEGCTDPLLKDKSLGLWKISDIELTS